MDVQSRSVTVTRRRLSVLDVAAEVLVARPAASLAEVAEAAGISRTTLHKNYPTRYHLLIAVAWDSLDRVERAIADADLGSTDEPGAAVLRRLVEGLLPLGPRLAFLFRQPALDDDAELAARAERIDEPIEQFAKRAQREGLLRPDVPTWWITSTLFAMVYTAWESVAIGKLAPADAPRLAFETALAGLGARSAVSGDDR